MAAYEYLFFSIIATRTIDILEATLGDPYDMVISAGGTRQKSHFGPFSSSEWRYQKIAPVNWIKYGLVCCYRRPKHNKPTESNSNRSIFCPRSVFSSLNFASFSRQLGAAIANDWTRKDTHSNVCCSLSLYQVHLVCWPRSQNISPSWSF